MTVTAASLGLGADRHGQWCQYKAALVTRVLDLDVTTAGPVDACDYRRLALATPLRARVTLDVDCTLDCERVWVDEDWVLVETKDGLRRTTADALRTSRSA